MPLYGSLGARGSLAETKPSQRLVVAINFRALFIAPLRLNSNRNLAHRPPARLDTPARQNEISCMKHSIRKYIICAALVIGCLWPVATQAQAHRGPPQSGIGGQVHGFIQSHNWNVQVASNTGQAVADFLTAADGSFQLSLKPGTYVLKAYIRNIGRHPILWGTPVEVTIGENDFKTVSLTITAPPVSRVE